MTELAVRPRHLLLSKLPLRDGPGFVTLQNGGPCFVPQRVFDRGRFLSDFAAIGYELIDSWEDHSLSCWIPFNPTPTVPTYTGLYLRRRP